LRYLISSPHVNKKVVGEIKDSQILIKNLCTATLFAQCPFELRTLENMGENEIKNIFSDQTKISNLLLSKEKLFRSIQAPTMQDIFLPLTMFVPCYDRLLSKEFDESYFLREELMFTNHSNTRDENIKSMRNRSKRIDKKEKKYSKSFLHGNSLIIIILESYLSYLCYSKAFTMM
jgi:hypothetical protein